MVPELQDCLRLAFYTWPDVLLLLGDMTLDIWFEESHMPNLKRPCFLDSVSPASVVNLYQALGLNFMLDSLSS